MMRVDIAIVGAGMAGASLAAEIGGAASVLLLERESQPGYHSTGRSAAFWSETYGGPAIQPLTTASGPWLEAGGFLHARGGLHIADAGSIAALDRLEAEFADTPVTLRRIGPAALEEMLPGLRNDWRGGLVEPTCRDIDVAGLHAAYLKRARQAGVKQICDAEVFGIRPESGRWRIDTKAGVVDAGVVVNAAGAWASGIGALAGALPVAITPYRRTVVQLAVDPAAAPDMPLVMDAAERFYFKPEAGGRLWLSPHDESPVPPSDVAPEELDVAIAIDRFEHVVDWRVLKRERAWAGLRSFAPDRAPVYGFDPLAAGFFWFAGQGGFGIQTAPAAAMIGAALLLGRSLPETVRDIDAGRYAPLRFGA